MATLKIKATADVSNAKAGIREITAEEAALLTKQTQANLQRRQDAARTAREQVKLAKESGAVSKQELNELRKLERIAAADARQAAREVAAAKKAAAGITRSESLARAAAERRDLDDFIIRQGEMAREARKLGGDDDAVPGSGRRGKAGSQARSALGDRMGKYAGPAAGAAVLMLIATTLQDLLAETRAARKESLDRVSDAGDAQNKLAEKMRGAGMKASDIAQVLAMTEGIRGTKTTAQLADVAQNALDDGQVDSASIIKAMRAAARGQPEQTMAQQVANARARMKRDAEIANQGAAANNVSDTLDEERAALERSLQYADGGSTVMAKLIGKIPGLFSERAGLETENIVNNWTMVGPARDRKTITVRLDPSSITNLGGGRPLGGD